LTDALSRAIACLEIAERDTHDPWYKKLREGILRDPKKFANFKVDDQKVFKFCKSSTGVDDGDFLWKQVLPNSSRMDVLVQSHDENAHFGVFKTLQRLKQRFYWPKMSRDVEEYVKNCEKGHESKDHRRVTSPPMGAAKTPTQPWQIISMDFLGPFPRSSSRNTHLFVVYDHYSNKQEILRFAQNKRARFLLVSQAPGRSIKNYQNQNLSC
jgi:Integrase zinc binding domain